ncbi:putative origin recognition complex subunit 2 [Lyophyllum shimeji]|uniref:Origin recognition complex subunit 2 n=1 Tax=Lyophyllum shimeji TaxID=47721 RepID=A0A9P3PMP9_LYOSH|nr:putative origin recognition complex subunit 2 [Lyophyllum shimeji]
MRRFGDDQDMSSDGDEVIEETEEELEEEEESGPEDFLTTTPSRGKRRRAAEEDNHNIIVQTAFDAYFTHATTRSRTSASVFSSLVPPLAAEEYAEAIASASKRQPSLPPIQASVLSESTRDLLFSRFMRELSEGFNLLMYGFGSKRRILNDFASTYCAKAGHVVVANAFHPDFSLKDLLSSIERAVPALPAAEGQGHTPEAQARRIHDFFAAPGPKRHLYLIIHNIDSAPLRTARAKSLLALLALTPRIHIVASIDHINAPLLWSTSECAARKPDPPLSSSLSHSHAHSHSPSPSPDDTHTHTRGEPRRGFAWLWHDLTTLEPYDFELAYVDRTSISGAHGGGPRKKADLSALQGAGGAAAMTETAALHILASVTQKAQKLFVLIGSTQLASIEDSGAGAAAGVGERERERERDLQQFGMGYDTLFTQARDNFIATNDTALRSLLGEFRDHGLVVSEQGTAGVGEVLWIPLRKERLASVLSSLKVDG